jgi:hypothetical protein
VEGDLKNEEVREKKEEGEKRTRADAIFNKKKKTNERK